MGRGKSRQRVVLAASMASGLPEALGDLLERCRTIQRELASMTQELVELQGLSSEVRSQISAEARGDPEPRRAAEGSRCPRCRRGRYRERTVMDDINDTLTCDNCFDNVHRSSEALRGPG